MDKSCEQGPKHAKSGKDDAEGIDSKRAGKVVPDRPPNPSGHPQRLCETDQIVAKQNNVRAFPRDIRTGPHRDAYARLDQGRGIVHALADHGKRCGDRS